MFTARYGLIPCIKQITFRLLKVNALDENGFIFLRSAATNNCVG